MSLNRLMIIDDDPDIGTGLAALGAKAGYECLQVRDSTEAKAHVREWQPSVIITDLQMPNIDGVVLLRLLAADNTKAKFMIVSGMGEKIVHAASEAARTRGLDIAETFTKPFAANDVLKCLERLKVEGPISAADISQALASDLIDVFFQPKCALPSGELVGAEALARWIHPTRGIVLPNEFLPMVMSGGFADSFFDRVLSKALSGARAMNIGAFDIAVNMSIENAESLTLPDRIKSICDEYKWPSDKLTLELTETTSMSSSPDVLDVLTRLRILGFKLSIDDFGTGYSSLMRLQQLAFTEIKIDRGFTTQIFNSKDSAVIVRTVLAMADSLSLQPVAEGIESAEVVSALVSYGCSVGQGYYFSEPLSGPDFAAWAREAHSRQVTAHIAPKKLA